MIGEFHAYEGASYVRELTNYGALPWLPSVAVNSSLQNPLQPGQLAAEDIYQTFKTWFFVEEPVLPGVDGDGKPTPAHINSFARNVGTYINVQTNTYIQNISGVYEMLAIAEQLARSPQMSAIDPDLGKSKQAVAAEMRNVLLQTLKDQSGASPQPIRETPIFPPPASDIRSWTGTFSGKLSSDAKLITRFSIHTNSSLFPGWQQDPSKAGNNVTVRFIYDFNSDGKPDRIEVLQNAPLSTGNSFLYENKLTEYLGDNYYGGPIGSVNIFLGGPDEQGIIRYLDPYPSRVTNGTLTVQIYGGSNPNASFRHPVPVSVDASPLTQRASWVKPPYEADPGQVVIPPICNISCFASPQYYLANLKRLAGGAVFISGLHFNQAVNTRDTDAIRQALDGGRSPQDRFNQQFVAAQLSVLAVGSSPLALQTGLSCYRLSFAPISLSSGVTLTPSSSLGLLLEQARAVARTANASDLDQLTTLLDLLNSGGCRR